MTVFTQRNSITEIHEFVHKKRHIMGKISEQLREWNDVVCFESGLSVLSYKAALLTGPRISRKNCFTPFNVRMALTYPFSERCDAAFPGPVFRSTLSVYDVALNGDLATFFGFRPVPKVHESRYGSFVVVASSYRNRQFASALAKMFAKISFNECVRRGASLWSSLRMVASVTTKYFVSFNKTPISFSFRCLEHFQEHRKINGDVQEKNRVNCRKAYRVTPRSICSQASGTPLEGSETTGDV